MFFKHGNLYVCRHASLFVGDSNSSEEKPVVYLQIPSAFKNNYLLIIIINILLLPTVLIRLSTARLCLLCIVSMLALLAGLAKIVQILREYLENSHISIYNNIIIINYWSKS